MWRNPFGGERGGPPPDAVMRSTPEKSKEEPKEEPASFADMMTKTRDRMKEVKEGENLGEAFADVGIVVSAIKKTADIQKEQPELDAYLRRKLASLDLLASQLRTAKDRAPSTQAYEEEVRALVGKAREWSRNIAAISASLVDKKGNIGSWYIKDYEDAYKAINGATGEKQQGNEIFQARKEKSLQELEQAMDTYLRTRGLNWGGREYEHERQRSDEVATDTKNTLDRLKKFGQETEARRVA